MNALRFIPLALCMVSTITAAPQSEVQKLHGIAERTVSEGASQRIFGGSECEKHKYPFMAGLAQANPFFYFCGGSIITERHVLTAAHCVKGYLNKPLVVTLGDHDRSRGVHGSNQIIPVQTIKIHEQYDGTYNDIAILFLYGTIRYNKIVKPICLPPPGFDVTGKSVKIIGWGSTGENGGPMSSVPKEFESTVILASVCSSTQICLDTKGSSSACSGDSGGPAAYLDRHGKYTIAGITSYSVFLQRIGRCNPDFDVYTKVEAFLPWINSQIDATYPGASYCVSPDKEE